jgi:hypothetical protein
MTIADIIFNLSSFVKETPKKIIITGVMYLYNSFVLDILSCENVNEIRRDDTKSNRAYLTGRICSFLIPFRAIHIKRVAPSKAE